MATPQPEWFTLQAAIVTALQATSGYGALDTPGIPVISGPIPTSDLPYKYILIGSDGTDQSGAFESDWLAMGARADRLERGTIETLVCSWDGSFDNAATKLADVQSMAADLATAAYGVADASASAIRVLTNGTAVEMVQEAAGLIVRLKVTINYELART